MFSPRRCPYHVRVLLASTTCCPGAECNRSSFPVTTASLDSVWKNNKRGVLFRIQAGVVGTLKPNLVGEMKHFSCHSGADLFRSNVYPGGGGGGGGGTRYIKKVGMLVENFEIDP